MARRYDPKISFTLADCCSQAYVLYETRSYQVPAGYVEVARFHGSFTFFNRLLRLIPWRPLRWLLLPLIWLMDLFFWNRKYFGFALRSKDGGHYIVAFRGTQDFRDAITDLDAVQVGLSRRLSDGHPAFQDTRVHQGFQLVAVSLSREVYRAAKDFRPEARVYVTGHSLGGAVAALTALMLKTRLQRDDVEMYSYAAPRVGDPKFKRAYDGLIQGCYRVVNLADVVPIVPPLSFKGWTYADLGKGEPWAFLNQSGDILGNHGIDAKGNYLDACRKKVPSAKKRRYPMNV